MISLMNQIVTGLREVFEVMDNNYSKTIIKEIYKSLPKGTYPKITVEEIDNSEITNRSTREGEQTTLLSYQITCYSRDMEEYDYIDSVKFMADTVNTYMNNNYKVQRLGNYVVIPYISDNTIMTCTLRYSCVYDKENNLIYKN